MILNPFKCENCDMELQPSQVLVGVNDKNDLIRKFVCCGYEVVVGDEK